MPSGVGSLVRRLQPVHQDEPPWRLSVSLADSETPGDVLAYSLYIETRIHSLTLTRTAVELVDLDRKLRKTHRTLAKLPIDPPKRHTKRSFLRGLSCFASLNAARTTYTPSPHFAPSNGSTSATPTPSDSTAALGAYLATICNNPDMRKARVWKRFIRARVDDIELVRDESAMHGNENVAERCQWWSVEEGPAEFKLRLVPPSGSVRQYYGGPFGPLVVSDAVRLQDEQTGPESHEFPQASAPRQVGIDDFEMIRVLGKGSAAKILLVKRKTTTKLYALKAMSKRRVLANDVVNYPLTEQAILKRMSQENSNPFVVKLWWSFHDKNNLFLVMDFLPGGDIAEQLARSRGLRRDQTRFYAAEIVEAVEGLHTAGVIYRDLKPENVLIGADGHVVLVDFGLSKEFNRRGANEITTTRSTTGPSQVMDTTWTMSFCGTAEYIAPEIIRGLQYSYQVDWWSFGTMLYEMLAGIAPFWAENHTDMYVKVLQDELQFPDGKTFDQDTKNLIRELLRRDPAARICEPRIKQHPYFSMIDWSHVYHKRYIPPFIPSMDPSNPSDMQNFDATFADMKPVLDDDVMGTDGETEAAAKEDVRYDDWDFVAAEEGGEFLRPPLRQGRPPVTRLLLPKQRRRLSSRSSRTGQMSSASSLSVFSDAGSEESGRSSLTSSSQRERNPPSYALPTHHLILRELDLTGTVTKLDIYPFDSGSAADIYPGTSHTSHPPSVAVKIFRRLHSEPENLEQICRALYEEARIWRQLDHPNILPFLGIALDLGLSPALVSPRCAGGPVMKYLQHNPKDSKEKLQMVIGVAAGLTYLHSQGIIHGNLCTKKVLVIGDGTPVVSGYGLSKALRQLASTGTTLFSSPIRFAAPEHFSVEVGTSSVRTPSGDVYAFSMVTLEILSGLEPYHHLPLEHAVLMHVLRGDRPTRTHMDQEAVSSRIWLLLTSLWTQKPSLRPSMSSVVSSLTRIRDGGSTADEGSDLMHEAVSSQVDNAHSQTPEKTSSGEETSFEDPLLPDSHPRDLNGRVTQDDLYPFAGGGNSNIYRGKLKRSDGRKIRVAIKMIRLSDDGSGQREDVLRRLRREVDVWSRLKHRNVLPFIGTCDDLAPLPVLISPFYKFGHVGTYIRKHPATNRAELVRGIALGLEFLHINNMIHGDLKVQNVLVDKRGVPCICDFGISKIINRRGFTTSSIGTAPYMAPELLFVIDAAIREKSPSTTKSSDVYSFALLVLEILTSEPPKGRPSRPIVTSQILGELQPRRADYDVQMVGNQTWSVLDRCWDFQPQLRPSISQVIGELDASFYGT